MTDTTRLPATPAAPDALAAACATPRLQPYRPVHKALRALFGQTLVDAGRLDPADPAERAALVESVERLLAICTDHLAHENGYLHEPLRQRAPRAVLPFDDDHHEHLAAIAALRLLLQRVRDARDDGAELAYELYLRLSQFVAESLAHMAEEESVMTQALWAHFDDAELKAMLDALHASLAPEEMALFIRTLGATLTTGELAHLLADLRATLPPPACEALVGLLQAELLAVGRHATAERLGLTAAA